MQHRLNLLKANTFEAFLLLAVAIAALGAGLATLTVAMPLGRLAAIVVALPVTYWASVVLFWLTDRAASPLRTRLHQAAHCTDCTPAALRD